MLITWNLTCLVIINALNWTQVLDMYPTTVVKSQLVVFYSKSSLFGRGLRSKVIHNVNCTHAHAFFVLFLKLDWRLRLFYGNQRKSTTHVAVVFNRLRWVEYHSHEQKIFLKCTCSMHDNILMWSLKRVALAPEWNIVWIKIRKWYFSFAITCCTLNIDQRKCTLTTN